MLKNLILISSAVLSCFSFGDIFSRYHLAKPGLGLLPHHAQQYKNIAQKFENEMKEIASEQIKIGWNLSCLENCLESFRENLKQSNSDGKVQSVCEKIEKMKNLIEQALRYSKLMEISYDDQVLSGRFKRSTALGVSLKEARLFVEILKKQDKSLEASKTKRSHLTPLLRKISLEIDLFEKGCRELNPPLSEDLSREISVIKQIMIILNQVN